MRKLGLSLTSAALALLVAAPSFADDALEFRWKIGIEANRCDGKPVHNGFENYGGAFAAKRQLSGGHFIENDAERKKIAAGIKFFCAHLFGRHVGDSSDGASGAGEVLWINNLRGDGINGAGGVVFRETEFG